MKEDLLQFIWQQKLFYVKKLQTTSGKPLEIIQTGFLNKNQGPDFIQARINYQGLIWVGSIEIHIKASDWIKHNHQHDPRFDKVILHVIWENDIQITDVHNQEIPTLHLEPLVEKTLLLKYKLLQEKEYELPCQYLALKVNPMRWIPWKEKLVMERLEQKYVLIKQLLDYFQNDWERVAWLYVASLMAGHINNTHFEQLIKLTPLKLFWQYKNDRTVVEAILYGQALLLHKKYQDEYPKLLYKEYQFYAQKHQLIPLQYPPDFMRMRPVSFPTIRLSQLADGLMKNGQLFSEIISAKSYNDCSFFNQWTAHEYWKNHYQFDHPVNSKIPQKMGSQIVQRILINAFVSLRFAYYSYYHDYRGKMESLDLLKHFSKEDNSITRIFTQIKVDHKSAFDSQAFIELFNEYCRFKKCLNCNIGQSILL